jgi:hypothetical protein
MKIILTNKCKTHYKPDQVKLTKKILANIPEKYLVGIGEIIFSDDSANPVVQSHISDKESELSVFHIFMGGFSRRAKFSRTHFNILFNGLLTDYIVHYIQPSTHDTDILAIKRNRVNHPEWLSFGIWTALFRLLTRFGFFYRRSFFIQKQINKGTNIIIRDLERHEKDSN